MNQIKTKHIYTVTPPKIGLALLSPKNYLKKGPKKCFKSDPSSALNISSRFNDFKRMKKDKFSRVFVSF